MRAMVNFLSWASAATEPARTDAPTARAASAVMTFFMAFPVVVRFDFTAVADHPFRTMPFLRGSIGRISSAPAPALQSAARQARFMPSAEGAGAKIVRDCSGA